MNLRTTRGKLTRYGLACGYFEQFERNSKRVRLFMDGSVLLIRVYETETGHSTQNGFRTMREARKAFSNLRFGKEMFAGS